MGEASKLRVNRERETGEGSDQIKQGADILET
jgi:hypothetical protein